MRTREEIERCGAIAQEAHRQLFWSIDKWTYFSWGVSKRQYVFYNDMPSLMMRVSGVIHKGWVIVSLDEGSDTYTVTLQSVRKEVKKVVEDVYADTLGSLIDSLVERAEGLSDDEYSSKAMADSERKWNQANVSV